MKQLNLDLGENYENSMPSPVDMKEEMMYPTFTIRGKKDIEFPLEGTMLIYYCKRSSTHRIDPDEDEHYECTVQVKKIISVEADDDYEAPTKSHAKESDDALNELASKIKHKMGKDDY